jgi:hypothetical protein
MILPGPQGLPKIVLPEVRVLHFSGAAGTRGFQSNITHNTASPFLFSTFFRPTTLASAQALLSNIGYFAASTNDFPLKVMLTTAGLVAVELSNGGDFAVDRTTNSDYAVRLNAWNYLAVGLITGSLTAVNLNGVITLDSHSVSANSTARLLTLGQHANLDGGGINGQPYTGQMYNPRAYNWDGTKFSEFSTLLARNVDARGGLSYEWQPKATGLVLRG